MGDRDENLPGALSGSRAADAFALGAETQHGRLDPRAAAYLEEQTRLARLQIANLSEQNAFELSHLRFRRFSDYARFALEVAGALVLVAIAAGICAAVWTASHDEGLVIEAFSVPPDMAARGLTGQAISAKLEDRLSAMQGATYSSRPASSYTNNWGDDIKVQIPETGVSIGEVYRLLVSWLGHQTHITGEVWHTANGIAVTARVGSGGATTFTGQEADIDDVVQKAGEAIYEHTQPFRYAIYEAISGDWPRADAELQKLSRTGTPRDRAWTYVGLSVHERVRGDVYGSVSDQEKAITIVSDFVVGYVDAADDSFALGHEEAALFFARESLRLLTSGRHLDLTAPFAEANLSEKRANTNAYVGDFASARNEVMKQPTLAGQIQNNDAQAWNALYLAKLHEGAGSVRSAFEDLPAPESPAISYERDVVRFMSDYAAGDWKAVLWKGWPARFRDDLAARHLVLGAIEDVPAVFVPRRERPYTAYATAETGDLAGALALIGSTPLDCDECARIRGRIDALAHNWNGAAYWFALVAARAPDIPFADTDWGEMLLAKGDYDAAIAKFREAHLKGPHFADPLEMWGEALMLKNRSDLALAKFEEADKYAPNWGRLHLKWGEALWWSGDKPAARQQFATASRLDLSAVDRQALVRASAWH